MTRRCSLVLALILTGQLPVFALSKQPAVPSGVPSAAPVATPAPAAPAPTDISSLLEPILAQHAVPSLAAVVVRGDGSIIFQGAAGVRQAGDDAKITLDDKFHLGSCTKAMTATLCAILIEDGTLSWDTTIADVFPELFAASKESERAQRGADNDASPVAPKANPAWKSVTLRNLLTHRGGVPTNPDKDGLWHKLWRFKGEGQDARRLLLEGVLATEPLSAPGGKFLYSNAGFAIAGHMAEVKTNTPWETLIQQRLFGPLGIATAGFGAPGEVRVEKDIQNANEKNIDQPRGHHDNGTPVQPGPGSDNPAAIGPAGTVHMTLADWSRFIALHLRGARNELRATGARLDHSCPPDPLTVDSFKVLHTPIDTTKSDPTSDDGYACGWGVTTRPWAAVIKDGGGGNARVLTHNGSNTLWFCVAWLSPERNFAVLVACNQGGDNAAKATDAAAAMLIAELGTLEKRAGNASRPDGD